MNQYKPPFQASIRSLLALVLLFVGALPISAQLTQVSDHSFDYQRVWRVENQTALVGTMMDAPGVDGHLGLRKLNLQTGASIEVYFNHQFEPVRMAGQFFAIHNGQLSWWNGEDLVQISNPAWGSVIKVLEPLTAYDTKRFAFASDETMVIWDVETQEAHVIATVDASLGWTYADGRLWCYSEQQISEIDPVSLEVLNMISFPENMFAIEGAALGPYVLLNSYNEPQEAFVQIARYDALSNESVLLISEEGEEAFIPSAASEARAIGNHIFLYGSGATNGTVTTLARDEMRLVMVEPATMSAVVAPAYSDMRMHWPRSPLVAEAELGAVAFGLFGPQGAEPYHLKDGALQPLQDIYVGTGSSLSVAYYGWFHNDVIEKDGKVFFSAVNAQMGHEVWMSDGSAEATRPFADLREGAAGARHIYFAESSTGQLYAQYVDNEGSFIYAMDTQVPGTTAPEENPKEWERGFTGPHTAGLLTNKFESYRPRIAKDGSVGIFQQVSTHPVAWMGANLDWLLPDRTDHPTLDDNFYFVLNEDGSLRFDVSLSHGMFGDVVLNRDPSSGATAIAFTNSERFVLNGQVVNTPFSNTTVLSLNPEGAFQWWQSYPWGGNINILDVLYENENIYLLGSYWHTMTWNGIQQPITAQGERQAFIAQLDAKGSQGWIRLLPESMKNPSAGRAFLTFDEESDALYAAVGGAKDYEFDVCGLNLPVNGRQAQVAALKASSGQLFWQTNIKANQMINLGGLVHLRNGSLWLGGYTYGSLEVQDATLAFQQNHLNCPANSFLAAFDAHSGALLALQGDAPEEGKLLQSLVAAENGFYTLSYLLAEELIYEHPLHQYGGRAAMVLDTRDAAGRLLDAELIPIAANGDQSVNKFLNSVGLSMAAHPSEGLYIAGHNHFSGSLGLIGARPASGSNIRSYVLQRRAAPAIPLAEVDGAFEENGVLHIYPNPLDGQAVVINIPSHEVNTFRQIAVYDVQGKRVLQRSIQPGSQQYLFDLSSLGNGFYLVRMEGDRFQTGKLLINR